jgi:hypothetical protein
MPNEPDESESDFLDTEVVQGEIIEHPNGELEVINPKAPPNKLTVAEKQRQAVALRLAGASLVSIAKQLGYANPSGAHQAVKAGMKEMRHEGQADYRDVTMARLENIILMNWPKAMKGDERAQVIVLQTIQQQRQMLGLDNVPLDEEQSEGLFVVGGNKDQYIEGLRKARGSLTPGGKDK